MKQIFYLILSLLFLCSCESKIEKAKRLYKETSVEYGLSNKEEGGMIFDLGYFPVSCYPKLNTKIAYHFNYYIPNKGMHILALFNREHILKAVIVENAPDFDIDATGKGVGNVIDSKAGRNRTTKNGAYVSISLSNIFYYLSGFYNLATPKTKSPWNPHYIAVGFDPRLPEGAQEKIKSIRNLLNEEDIE